jgi:hypothetical protein
MIFAGNSPGNNMFSKQLITAGLNYDDPVCGKVKRSEEFDLEVFCELSAGIYSVDYRPTIDAGQNTGKWPGQQTAQ